MSNRIEKARAEVEKLATVERSLSARLLAAGVALQAATEDAGEATFRSALDETAPGPEPERVGRCRADLEALSMAINKARAARLETIPKVWRAEAEDLHDQARALRSEADKRKPKTERLLKELAEWEAVEYVPTGPVRPEMSVSGNLIGGAPTVVLVPTPKTRLLEIQAEELERKAEGLQARMPTTAGRATANTTDELVAALFVNPMLVGPRVDVVLDWARVGEKRELERRSRGRVPGQEGYADRDKPLHYELSWAPDWTIHPADSHVGVGVGV